MAVSVPGVSVSVLFGTEMPELALKGGHPGR